MASQLPWPRFFWLIHACYCMDKLAFLIKTYKKTHAFEKDCEILAERETPFVLQPLRPPLDSLAFRKSSTRTCCIMNYFGVNFASPLARCYSLRLCFCVFGPTSSSSNSKAESDWHWLSLVWTEAWITTSGDPQVNHICNSYSAIQLVWGFPKTIMFNIVVPRCSHIVYHVPMGLYDVFIYWWRHWAAAFDSIKMFLAII